jgi:uncharacterized protein YbjT (DUF2867 family)
VRGHEVRGTTRDSSRTIEIESAGAEGWVADPDRIATLVPALEHVTIVCLLLGSARGSSETLTALHGPRLEMLVRRLLDTTVHGIVYEIAGSVPSDLLNSGAEFVRRECERFRIPFSLLDAEPEHHAAWRAAALAAVDQLVTSSGR